MVSVPLRGLHFSNLAEKETIKKERSWFPSPCGDCISQINRNIMINKAGGNAFPSPCGDCISQMNMLENASVGYVSCFRPLTGTAFLK